MLQQSHCVGPDGDSRADVAKFRRLLKDLRLIAELSKRDGDAETADAATDDGDSHSSLGRRHCPKSKVTSKSSPGPMSKVCPTTVSSFPVPCWFRVLSFEFRVSGRVSGFEFRVSSFRFPAPVSSCALRVCGFRFWVHSAIIAVIQHQSDG